MSNDPTLKIASRRRFIDEQVDKLQRELAVYEAERAELDVAERVYKRFSAEPSVGSRVEKSTESPREQPVQTNGHDTDEESEETVSGPTLPEMVLLILDEATASGRKGVDSSEMLKAIQTRWKPDCSFDQIRPTLWRMVKKQKKLRKRGKLYSRIEDLGALQPQSDLARH